ncbi:MAG: NAD(P)H-binding protein [Solirubrobacteraceae bacterium]
MLLLTGATGQVGSALLGRLLADGVQVRCLVRDPRRLGAQRVRVQIALGDLADPPSFRNAMRGVDTVVHLAAAIRDQPQGSIEELNAIATWRMVQAARQAGVQRFLFFSAIGASPHHRCRFFRAKALAERAVIEAGIDCVIFAPSIVYAPADHWLTLIERLSLLGLTAVPGNGRATFQPIWTEDVADCVMAALRAGVPHGTPRGHPVATGGAHLRYELAGPQTLSHDDIIRLVLRSRGRRTTPLHVPSGVVAAALRTLERAMGERAPVTWDEAELMQVPMLAARGAADCEALGVLPQPMQAVLGAS